MDYLKRLTNGIGFIEANLCDKPDLHEIAAEACLSPFHFHRIFTALTGETPGDYIRNRRLTLASEMLVESDMRILDIAITVGYESQEAFSRAFKKLFRVTPNRFRSGGGSSHFLRRDALNEEFVRHLTKGVAMEPGIITQPSFTLCGVEGSTSKNNNRIAGIWRKLFKAVKRIPGQTEPGVMYGVGEYMDPAGFTDDTDFRYLAGVRVESGIEVPKGLAKKLIPESRWAVFTHNGGVDTLPKTFDYIYGQWALRTNERIREADDYECYDARFNPRDPAGSEIDIYIPLE